LVVIAVISILAAILFPVFARARENARRASCMSNLKQIGLGIMMYTQDYDEKYPQDRIPTAQTPPDGVWASNLWFWQQMIYPYTKSDQIYICPSSPITGQKPYDSQYGINTLITGWQGATSISLGAVNSPSTTYLAMDSGMYSMDMYYIHTPAKDYWYIPGTKKYAGVSPSFSNSQNETDYASDGRHFDGNNTLFADGHVKWLKTADIWSEAMKCHIGSSSSDTCPTDQSDWNPYAS
jgi:prepilin-type processing-associated H-X9-DG protein